MEFHRLALPVGFQIEHFRIEAVLGKGGFGITYLATDTHLGKRVAIKELLPDSIATRIEGRTVVPQTVDIEAAGGVPGFPGIYFDDSAAYQIV